MNVELQAPIECRYKHGSNDVLAAVYWVQMVDDMSVCFKWWSSYCQLLQDACRIWIQWKPKGEKNMDTR